MADTKKLQGISMNSDDWHIDTQSRLEKSSVYITLKEKCADDSAGPQVLSLIDEATTYAYQRTKSILINMGEFTLHDGDHLFRVLSLMEKLISKEQLDKLTIPELMLLILSAFFHDIGMAPNKKTVLSWRKVWDISPTFDDAQDREEFESFNRYYLARPDQSSKLEDFLALGDNSNADLLKDYIVADYIRVTHAKRARDVIKEDWLEKIRYKDIDLTTEFAEICFSHNEDPLSVLELDRNLLCATDVYANLQLVAVVLRLADLLDFDAKRTPSILFSHLFVRHPISVREWNKHRSVQAWTINQDIIQFHAKCEHPAIEASIHEFCDVIDKELMACNNIISSINDFNQHAGNQIKIKIPLRVDRSKIETKKDIDGKPIYLYRETQFNLSKNQVIDLLMGTKLYGNPQVALRELLQNSIDACLLRSALEASWDNHYEPLIRVRYYKEGNEDILEVIDNGIGMDQKVIDSYYSKVGSSFYKSSEFYDLKSRTNAQFTPTSRFGIGILSSFMVADTLVVDTRKLYGPHDSSPAINLRVEGQDSIFWIKPGELTSPGTKTKLYLRKDENPWKRMDEEKFIQSVENVIPNPPFEIMIETSSQTKTKNTGSFQEIHASSLKGFSWDSDENIKQITVELNDKEKGFVGSAVIALLESHGIPTATVEMTSKSVDIDGASYKLEKTLNLNGSEISESTTSITIDENGNVEPSDATHDIFRSESRLSLHGIEVPHKLFSGFWERLEGKVRLDWPFPMLLVVDICGDRDLDLNSPRTEIVMSDKWVDFEEELALEICTKIADSVEPDYWEELKKVMSEGSKNEVFLRSLNKVPS